MGGTTPFNLNIFFAFLIHNVEFIFLPYQFYFEKD